MDATLLMCNTNHNKVAPAAMAWGDFLFRKLFYCAVQDGACDTATELLMDYGSLGDVLPTFHFHKLDKVTF